MRVGLILPNNIWFCPFADIYVRVLKSHHVDYEIISWNRDGRDPKVGFQYEVKPNMTNNIRKIYAYIKYSSFVKKVLNRNKFDKLIVFCPQVGIFLSGYLEKHFKNNYIFDFRDLSIEQKSIFKKSFTKLLNNSFANVISSPGFLKKLPTNIDYILSHNFNIDTVKKALSTEPEPYNTANGKTVLTIGGIRDYSSNAEVIQSLGNQQNVIIKFVGRGHAAASLEEFSKTNKIVNISFEGYYPKEKEGTYIKECTFLNIYYPKIISHSTALSNRFYNSLIYKRPMIVTSNSIQGDFVEKYKLGVVVDDCCSLNEKLDDFLRNNDYSEFAHRCNSLLESFVEDYQIFENCIKQFLLTR